MAKRYSIFVSLLIILLLLRSLSVITHQVKIENGETVKIHARLTSVVTDTGQYQRFSISDQGRAISVTAPESPVYSYGDILDISGKIKQVVLSNGRTINTFFLPNITQYQDKNILYRFAVPVRKYVSSLFHSYLPTTSASLLLGIVFGIKETILKSFNTDLQVTGVYHIIAASGMNVTFVASMLLSFFGHFFKRQLAILAALVGIFSYVCIAGFEPSILRAAIMAGIAFISQMLGRQSKGVFALFLTGWIMLMIDPLSLFDIGFQLSFLSTIGILLLKPIFDAFFTKLPVVFQVVKEDLATTTASQIFTLPVLLSAFSQYGLVSILVNGLILWTVPILMLLGSIAVFVSFLPILSEGILLLSLPLLSYMAGIITWFGSRGFIITIGSFPWPFAVAYYAFLAGVLLLVLQ